MFKLIIILYLFTAASIADDRSVESTKKEVEREIQSALQQVQLQFNINSMKADGIRSILQFDTPTISKDALNKQACRKFNKKQARVKMEEIPNCRALRGSLGNSYYDKIEGLPTLEAIQKLKAYDEPLKKCMEKRIPRKAISCMEAIKKEATELAAKMIKSYGINIKKMENLVNATLHSVDNCKSEKGNVDDEDEEEEEEEE